MNLKEQIKRYVPYNEQEEKDKEVILKCMDTFEDVLTRENTICHFTASNWIVNKDKTKVLMIHHNIYHSWAWTGGHADGNSNLKEVAQKEAKEETRIQKLTPLGNGIFGLQIITMDSHRKRGQYVPAHLHLDCCFLWEADETEKLEIKEDENSGIQWVKIDKIMETTNEAKMKPIYQKLIQKTKTIKD